MLADFCRRGGQRVQRDIDPACPDVDKLPTQNVKSYSPSPLIYSHLVRHVNSVTRDEDGNLLCIMLQFIWGRNEVRPPDTCRFDFSELSIPCARFRARACVWDNTSNVPRQRTELWHVLAGSHHTQS